MQGESNKTVRMDSTGSPRTGKKFNLYIISVRPELVEGNEHKMRSNGSESYKASA